MSEYTYVNIATDHPNVVRSETYLGGMTRTYEASDGRKVVYNRLGGNEVDSIKDELLDANGKMVYDIPIFADLDEGQVAAEILVDLFEDTGNSHDFEIYRVHAFEDIIKVAEHKVFEESEGSSEKVREAARKSVDFDPRVVF